MSALDPKVAAVLDNAKADSDDEDALISALEADDDLSSFREQRLQELHAEVARAKAKVASDHGTYGEIKDEKAVMDITTQTKLCVVHFFKPDFGRCAVMDGHLEVRDSCLYPGTIRSIKPAMLTCQCRPWRQNTLTRGSLK